MSATTYRLWDEDYQLLAEWPHEVPVEELTAGRHITIDYPGGTRWSGTVADEGLVHDLELLKTVTVWANPFLPWVQGESKEEFELRAEAARVRGDFGLEWMINGFPDQRAGGTP